MRLSTILVAVFLLPGLCACSRLDQKEIEEKAGQQFITINFSADSNLNCFEGVPSSLALCVYQLSGRSGFDSARDDPDGLDLLLLCEKFDPSVVGRERFFFDPGKARSITLERRRGANFLVLAAGYHRAGFSDSVMIIDLPAVRVSRRVPSPPTFTITLGEDHIQRELKPRGFMARFFGRYE